MPNDGFSYGVSVHGVTEDVDVVGDVATSMRHSFTTGDAPDYPIATSCGEGDS